MSINAYVFNMCIFINSIILCGGVCVRHIQYNAYVEMKGKLKG